MPSSSSQGAVIAQNRYDSGPGDRASEEQPANIGPAARGLLSNPVRPPLRRSVDAP
jgi:hypothetical protein